MGACIMAKTGLKNYQPGESFIGFCIIRKNELKQKQNGEPYLALELGDKSGRLRAKIWKDAANHYRNLSVGQTVKIKGKIQSYLNAKELHVERIRKSKPGEVSLDDIIPESKKDVEKLADRFFEHYEKMENTHLKKLLELIFPDRNSLQNYLKIPSGKLWHHNYLFGLLEHVVCMLDVADAVHCHYPQLQIDLLRTAILLHNIAKPAEYDIEGYIEFSTEGRLLGHVMAGYQTVQETIAKVEDFPEDLRLQLLHLIISHQGTTENGAPVPPMTLEAEILYRIDQLDIQANAFQRILENDKLPDSRWTKYNNMLSRFLYDAETEKQQPE
jgi:3'-5' exoribonuclease